MSRLLLVRHGQARAFEDDSDRLSEAGFAQARRLAEWLAANNATIQETRCGTLLRQRQTMDAMRDVFPTLPAPVIDEGWNEFDSTGVMTHVAPLLAAADSSFAALLQQSHAHRGTNEANRHFQRMFEVLMSRWVNGEISAGGVKTWVEFQSRVRAALQEIVSASGDSRTVLVVASGGSIATAVQTVLQAPPRTALELNWRMRNTSLTELLYSRGRVSLDIFNATPHLSPRDVTYR